MFDEELFDAIGHSEELFNVKNVLQTFSGAGACPRILATKS